MFWQFLFWLEWSEVRERQRGLINNLYDDMESHNSKAVSEIYLSTGYFQSLLPIGNGTWQKDAWTKRTKNYWLVEYKSIQEYLSLVTGSSALSIYICNDFRSDDDAYSFDIYCMIEYHFLVPLENDGILFTIWTTKKLDRVNNNCSLASSNHVLSISPFYSDLQ